MTRANSPSPRKTKNIAASDTPPATNQAPELEAPYLAATRPRLTRIQWTLIGILLACALFLRGYGLNLQTNSTGDEYHYGWVGLSLLHGEPPTGWSYLSAYSERNLYLGKILHESQFTSYKFTFSAVRPAFDHPPLYSLLAGVFATLTHSAHPVIRSLEPISPTVQPGQFTHIGTAKLRMWDLNMGRLRLLSVLLFAWAFVMLFEVARRAYSFNVAFAACLFFSTMSHLIIHQRAIVTETLLTPLLLTNLYVMQVWLAGEIPLKRFGIWTVCLCAAATLTKLIGLNQAAVIVFMLLAAGKRRAALIPAAGAALGLALFMLYGWLYDWETFRAVLQSHAQRFAGFEAITKMILNHQLFHTANFSYVLLVGWIAMIAMGFTARGVNLFAAPLVFAAGFIFFSAVNSIFGWHNMIFYPFMCLALGLLAAEGWKGENPMASLTIVVLFVPFLFQTSFLANNKLQPGFYRYTYLAVVGLLLGGAPWLPNLARRWAYRLSTAVVVSLVLMNEVQLAWNGLFHFGK